MATLTINYSNHLFPLTINNVEKINYWTDNHNQKRMRVRGKWKLKGKSCRMLDVSTSIVESVIFNP
mgnify:CR=1 FL=1